LPLYLWRYRLGA